MVAGVMLASYGSIVLWYNITMLDILTSCLIALQSRVGPVEWLKPYTDETIIELGQRGVKSLLAVPIR